MRGSRLRAVDLVDEPPPAAPAAVPATVRGRVIAAAGVALVALLAVQLTLTARQQAADARLAALPGVIRPIGDPPRVAWRGVSQDGAVVAQGLSWHGVAVGLRVGDDGSQSVDAIDERTGGTRWSTALLGPDPDRPAAGLVAEGSWCGAVPGDSPRVACLVTNGYLQDVGPDALVPATVVRLVVLDARDGQVVLDRPLASGRRMVVLRRIAVVASTPPDGSLDLVGYDLHTGQVRWRHRVPGGGTGTGARQFWRLVATPDRVAVQADTVTVLRDDGRVLHDAAGGRLRPSAFEVSTAGGRIVIADYGGGPSTVVVRDADVRTVRGIPARVTADDGSLPGLLLTVDTGVHAWDGASAAARWDLDIRSTTGAVIFGGRVYLGTAGGVVAVDGGTGTVLWDTEDQRVRVPGAVMTDGHLLFVADLRATNARPRELVAYSLTTGRQEWAAPLPPGVDAVGQLGRLVASWSRGGRLVVLG